MPLTVVLVWQFGWDGSKGLPVDEELMSFISGSETWAHFSTFLCLRVCYLKSGDKARSFWWAKPNYNGNPKFRYGQIMSCYVPFPNFLQKPPWWGLNHVWEEVSLARGALGDGFHTTLLTSVPKSWVIQPHRPQDSDWAHQSGCAPPAEVDIKNPPCQGPKKIVDGQVVLPGELGWTKIKEQVLYCSQHQKRLIILQQRILFGCKWPSLYPVIPHSSYLFLAFQLSFQREHLYALTNSAIGEKIGF